MRPALINVMAKAVEKAGKSLRRDFGEVEHLQISRKGPADFVSNADLQAQKILREELGKARPSFGFIMEENDGIADSSSCPEKWIVDPLDGTTNFLHGIPHFAISIGVEKQGEIVAGMVYNPITDEMYWAEKGIGCYCGSKRLRVSGRKDFSECLIATGLPFKGSKKNDAAVMREVAGIMSQVAGIRRFGAAALDLAYVAAGRYDGYWETGLGIYDVAGGSILVKEAGGFISPMRKGEDPVKSGGMIASNAAIHDQLVRVIRSA